MTDTITGSIKFFSTEKKYGFVTIGAKDHFVCLDMVEAAGFQSLDMSTGAIVEFIPETVDGNLRVCEIKRIGLELARPKKAKVSDRRAPAVMRPAPKPELPTVEIGRWLVGSVATYVEDRGFGFLSVEGHSNVFFHISQVENGMVPVVNAAYYFLSTDGNRGPIATSLQVYARKQVDAYENKKLFSVKLGGYLAFYEVDTTDENGQVTTERLTTICLALARQAIGKVISHPTPANAGKSTNVVGIGPKKGPSPPAPVHGSGQPKKQKAA